MLKYKIQSKPKQKVQKKNNISAYSIAELDKLDD